MKVICINDKPTFAPPQCPSWIIKEGEIYEVVYECETKWGLYYELSIQLSVGYPSEYFIPLSDISETEMERNYNKVTQ